MNPNGRGPAATAALPPITTNVHAHRIPLGRTSAKGFDMSVYVIIDLDVHDPEVFAEYVAKVGPLITQYGGKVVAMDPQPELYEGDWAPSLVVILEFETRAAVRAFYDAPEYHPVRAIRISAATSNGLIVVGR